ncbi:TetR family transcriptional regulator [Mycobacterium sp. MBM]|nr:TetR family transcriptional regulator [Mycobacterium sp. MBM]
MTAQGYDTFQIRAVAHAAHVSPGTLYRHFPSKDVLLIACLENWLSDLFPVVYAEVVGIRGPVSRVLHVSARIALGLIERPLLADAFVRSYLLTNSATTESDVVRARLSALFALAVGDSHGGRSELCELVTDIWTVNLPALVQRRIGLTDLQERLERSVSATCGT